MSYGWRWFVPSLALGLVLAAPMGASAQGNPDPFSFKFNSGQSVQPYFEGWSKSPDGSFLMWFGYMNRNYVETPITNVGADNKFDPLPVDRGQPSYFAPRTQRMMFSVSVPKDWGKKELTWSITTHGVTEKAVAWLQPEWEIDPVYAGKFVTTEMKKNKAPVITMTAPTTATMPTVTLTATVQDDGLPVVKTTPPTQAVGQETPPTLKPAADQAEIPVNVPTVGGGGRGGAQLKGLIASWSLWRGPAPVKFDVARAVGKDGKAQAFVTFTTPGTYGFRA